MLRDNTLKELRAKSAEEVSLEKWNSNEKWFKELVAIVLRDKARGHLPSLSNEQLSDLADRLGTHPWPGNAIWEEQDRRAKTTAVNHLHPMELQRQRPTGLELLRLEISRSNDDTFKQFATYVVSGKPCKFLNSFSDQQLVEFAEQFAASPLLAQAIKTEQNKRRSSKASRDQGIILSLTIKELERVCSDKPPAYTVEQIAYAEKLLSTLRPFLEMEQEVLRQLADSPPLYSKNKYNGLPLSIVKKLLMDRCPEVFVGKSFDKQSSLPPRLPRPSRPRRGARRWTFDTNKMPSIEDGMDEEFNRPRWC